MIRDYSFGQMKIDGEEHRHAQRSTGYLGVEKRVSPPSAALRHWIQLRDLAAVA